MGREAHKPRWHVVGQSVRGASHVRANLPNQDAIRWDPSSGEAPLLILAVSDGHGSAKCFRSDQGSLRAVEVVTSILRDFLAGQSDLVNLSAVKRMAEERLPQSLARTWKDAVATHLAEHPFTEEEWTRLVEKDGSAARQAVEANSSLAYGATILAVLVTESFILYLQLGDGDILCVDSAGDTTRPFSHDERLMANQTTSLCAPDAWKEVRVYLTPSTERPPSMILLSTDGYANSFRSEEDFLKVGRDYLQMIRSEGIDRVAKELADILEDSSRRGSGDDTTLGILKRAEETDIDTINWRITALESAFLKVPSDHEWQQVKTLIDEQKRRLDDYEHALHDSPGRADSLIGRVAKLQWGVLVVALLAVAGIVLATAPWRGLSLWAKQAHQASSATESGVLLTDKPIGGLPVDTSARAVPKQEKKEGAVK